uniref:Uncharacterized protein n=1 Tax=Avena sativa TaxID=4498 RepID=A0ACD5WGG7_AVESA
MSSAPAGDAPHDAPAPDAPAGGGSVPASRSIAERWKMEAVPARARLLLRAAAWLFSFLALVVMATDVHGRGGPNDFSTYPEYNYCLGVSIIALLYATAQLLRDLHRLSSGRDLVAGRKVAAIVDFTGDQVVAYFLISGLSAAAPVTDYMRQGADNLFNDSAAAAISMAFFAFVAIGLSALVSGYNLSLEALV